MKFATSSKSCFNSSAMVVGGALSLSDLCAARISRTIVLISSCIMWLKCSSSSICAACKIRRYGSSSPGRWRSIISCRTVSTRDLLSFLPSFLAAFRSAWYARYGQGSSFFLPEVVALYHRGAYAIQAGHSIGIIH